MNNQKRITYWFANFQFLPAFDRASFQGFYLAL